ncbi:MAG: hypothetical protein COW85_04095 [Ignavibacteria bacterium CG22_combo_CG10-13_8_21_14_all_37_15]|nr:MAG: hypothetical protein COW85_04095 [Ignavibacteria bacterium CG22_combo_CG10-13_8_21_14_all_37_15]PIQ08947.1 MAG: hypothetical protein COW71_09090 [Ignavibacteriales bacterium CG18_big_fil_WC_8_21_14_2_50_31_20]
MNKENTKSIYNYIWVIVIFLFAILVFQLINVKSTYVSKIVLKKENKEARELLDSIRIRIEGKSLSELTLIPESKISEKTNAFILFYIPSKICFTCAERLIKFTSQKKKNEMVFIIENSSNPALQGLIKYYKIQDICEYDKDSIFLKKVSNGVQVKKPLAFTIKGKIIKSSYILGDEVEKELETIFNKND